MAGSDGDELYHQLTNAHLSQCSNDACVDSRDSNARRNLAIIRHVFCNVTVIQLYIYIPTAKQYNKLWPSAAKALNLISLAGLGQSGRRERTLLHHTVKGPRFCRGFNTCLLGR